MKHKKEEHFEPSSFSFVDFVRSLYLTATLFSSNDLISSASSCAFGFLLSVIPVSMIICVVLLNVLHASPEMISSLASFVPFAKEIFDIDDSIQKTIGIVTNFEVVVTLAIVWMARRFFFSLSKGLKRVFTKEMKPRAVRSVFSVFASEFLFVIFFSLFIFLVVSLRAFVFVPLEIPHRFDFLYEIISKNVAQLFSYGLVFVLVLLTYKFASRVKPSWTSVLIATAGSCISFWVLAKLFRVFVNVNRYDVVYGILSKTIVFLLEVYFFFLIFFFCAQWIYVYKFFLILSLGELYLLHDEHDGFFKSRVKRLLFANWGVLWKEALRHLKKGHFAYHKGEASGSAFYVASGKVALKGEDGEALLEAGSFFGEKQCLMKSRRREDAVSLEDTLVVEIPRSVFSKLIEKNPRASIKALS